MSDTEDILLHTGLPPEKVAQRLAEVLRATLTRHDDGLAVRRPIRQGEQEGTVGGLVKANDYGEENPEPGDESTYDGYDTLFEIWSTIPNEELQHVEAEQIFSEIIANLPWPAVHLKVSGVLYSAWNPHLGRTDFPPKTSYDALHRDRWQPYAHPDTPI